MAVPAQAKGSCGLAVSLQTDVGGCRGEGCKKQRGFREVLLLSALPQHPTNSVSAAFGAGSCTRIIMFSAAALSSLFSDLFMFLAPNTSQGNEFQVLIMHRINWYARAAARLAHWAQRSQ